MTVEQIFDSIEQAEKAKHAEALTRFRELAKDIAAGKAIDAQAAAGIVKAAGKTREHLTELVDREKAIAGHLVQAAKAPGLQRELESAQAELAKASAKLHAAMTEQNALAVKVRGLENQLNVAMGAARWAERLSSD